MKKSELRQLIREEISKVLESANEGQLNEDAKDKIPAADLVKIEQILNSICRNYSGSYWKILFDPQQTHAIYGVHKDRIESLKDDLTKMGAAKFRVVKNGNLPILCFNASKMKNNKL
jgi:hypothetical protein